MGITDHVVDLKKWRLDITGNIKEPRSLSYSQVVALPSFESAVLMICPGIFVNHGKWKGISMKSLLEKVKMEKGITHVTFSGANFRSEKVERFPIEDVLSNKVFLAYEVNSESLPQKHGFPLRVVAEGYYGDFWVKYVDNMKVE
ncbi:molybdopterin-dependent oxidoreductase [Thermodesulfobacteriota bacterium]